MTANPPVSAEESQRRYRLVVFQMLDSGPSAPLATLFMTVAFALISYGENDGLFTSVWVVISLVLGVGGQALLLQFRRASPAQRQARAAFWQRYATAFAVLTGLSYAAFVLGSFPFLSLDRQMLASLVGAVYMVNAIGPFAIVGSHLITLLGLSRLVAWMAFGAPIALPMSLLSLAALVNYPPARRKKSAQVMEEVARIEHYSQLTEVLRARNAELDAANRNNTLLLAAASHDLRQPVQALALLVENLERAETEEAHASLLELLRGRAKLLEEIVHSVMDASQLDSGDYRPSMQQFSVYAVLAECVDDYREAARRKGLSLILIGHGIQSVWIESDRGLFGRVIANLLSNAVKYTPQGQVLVTAERLPDGSASISVVDSGVGISQADQQRMFLPYERFDARGKAQKEGGLGIGLHIVDKAAHLLGLQLTCQSEPGVGSTFCVNIPAAIMCTPKGQTALEFSRRKPLLKGQVLLVEDDPAVCSATADKLGQWGYVVSSAASLPQALALLDAGFVPDILMTDYHLSTQETGLDCIAQIRARTGLERLPALLVTGDIQVTSAHVEHLSGVLLLHKPVRPKRLQDALNHLHNPV